MKERLVEFLEYMHLKNSDFEKISGLSNGFVNNIGDTIREKNLEKISKIFPDLNLAWLKTGIGNMLNNQDVANQGSGNNNINGVNGDVKIHQNDFLHMIEIQKEYIKSQMSFSENLKICQSQLTTSQNQLTEFQRQMNVLIEIINKNK